MVNNPLAGVIALGGDPAQQPRQQPQPQQQQQPPPWQQYPYGQPGGVSSLGDLVSLLMGRLQPQNSNQGGQNPSFGQLMQGFFGGGRQGSYMGTDGGMYGGGADGWGNMIGATPALSEPDPEVKSTFRPSPQDNNEEPD